MQAATDNRQSGRARARAATGLTANRRENMRRLIADRGLKPLAAALGYKNSSYLVQMCGPHPIRPVSEANARRYEEALGLAAGTLDLDPSLDPGRPASDAWDGTDRRAKPAASPVVAGTDTPVIAEVVRVTTQMIGEAGLTMTPERFANMVTLVLADAREHGDHARPEFIKGLVEIVKG